MSLLDDFESICAEQDDSMEVKLRKFVVKDKYPIIMGMAEYVSRYHIADAFNIGREREPIYRNGLPDRNRVYIVVNSVMDNITSKIQTYPDRTSYNIVIDELWTPITNDEYYMYLKYHEEFWKNADHSTERISTWVSDLILYGRVMNVKTVCDRSALVYSEVI